MALSESNPAFGVRFNEEKHRDKKLSHMEIHISDLFNGYLTTKVAISESYLAFGVNPNLEKHGTKTVPI